MRVDTVFSPAFDVTPEPASVPDGFTGLILTSVNGVEQAARLGLRDLPAWCVGDRTASAASDIGLQAMSAGGNADDLVTRIIHDRPTGPLLHVSGKHTRGDIVGRLRDAGIAAHRIIAYGQDLLPPSQTLIDLANGTRPVVTPVFSPRSALPLAAVDWQAPIHGVAMSAAVAEALQTVPCDTIVTVPSPNSSYMLKATVGLLDQLSESSARA